MRNRVLLLLAKGNAKRTTKQLRGQTHILDTSTLTPCANVSSCPTYPEPENATACSLRFYPRAPWGPRHPAYTKSPSTHDPCQSTPSKLSHSTQSPNHISPPSSIPAQIGFWSTPWLGWVVCRSQKYYPKQLQPWSMSCIRPPPPPHCGNLKLCFAVSGDLVGFKTGASVCPTGRLPRNRLAVAKMGKDV